MLSTSCLGSLVVVIHRGLRHTFLQSYFTCTDVDGHTSLPNSLHSVTFRRRLGRQHFYYGPSWASWCGRAAHHHPLWTGPRWTRWWHYKDTVVLRLWFKTDSCRSEQKHICSTPLYKHYWSPQPRFLPPDCHGNFRRRDRTVDNIVVEHTCQHTSPSQWLYLSLRSLY